MGLKATVLVAVALVTGACSSTNAAPASTTSAAATTTAGPASTTASTSALTTVSLPLPTVPPRSAAGADYASALKPVIDSLAARSCLVVTREGATVVDHHGSLALIPASTEKLLVGAASLEVLDATQAALVGEMLRNSDKNTAERLLLAIGGLPGLRAWLGATGLETTGLVINDGTGFDLGNRLSCRFLVGLLDRAGATSALAAALPVAGQSGTLELRLRNTPAVGRVKAKTGTLPGVSALAGFATARDGAMLSFAIIVNAPRADTAADRLWSAVATALVTA